MIVSIHKFIVVVIPASHLGIYEKAVIIDIEPNSREQWNRLRWRIARFKQESITF